MHLQEFTEQPRYLQLSSVRKELARLERNKERRHAREKQKGIFRAEESQAGSPSSTPAPAHEKGAATTRKCANCGEVGHIRTNSKLCPLLNGTIKRDPGDSGFGNGAPPPAPKPSPFASNDPFP